MNKTYAKPMRAIAGIPGPTGATGPPGPESKRAALVEQVAVDALRRAEALEEEVLTGRIEGDAADAAIVAGTIPAVLETLPDDSVWLTPECEQAIRDSGVYSAAFKDAYDNGVIRVRSLRHGFAMVGDYLCVPDYKMVSQEFASLADFANAKETAATEIAQAARDRMTFNLVRNVCRAVLADKGLTFFTENYAVVWAKWTTSKGLVWSSYYYKRGEGPGYVND